MPDIETRRLMIKVARLYHTHGMRQTDIAKRLQISQSRVSRLLTQAEEMSVVRTIVAAPREINAPLEEAVERTYGLSEVHVVDVVGDDEVELTRDLASAMAMLLHEMAFDVSSIGFTSWSKTLRQTVASLQPLRTHADRVIETVGDMGPPAQQYEAAKATARLAAFTGGDSVFLRAPGVVSTVEIRDLFLSHDSYARDALSQLDDLDFLLVGLGADSPDPTLGPGSNLFSEVQYARLRDAGAVGEICLHFFDADGNLVDIGTEEVIIGITPQQLKAARRRWGVAGGARKHVAIRAALRGGWIDALLTDVATAEFLIGEGASDAARTG
jgi:DNA-binding transcriptional regulator LsrR (DeoR family)